MTVETLPSGDVLLARHGRLACVTLDRPAAINALTLAMVRDVDAALDACAADDAVEVVMLDSTSPRGFCAGGDIRVFHDSAVAGDDRARRFWAEEYRLDARIARFRKPVVAIMDGLVLGGGVGLTGHAAVRVVTERSAVGMPEVAIGFAPDVGADWLLARAPGELGTYLALTGERVGPGDALALGLADHVVPSDELDGLRDALAVSAGTDPAAVIAGLADHVPPAPLLAERWWIDGCFGAASVGEIVARLVHHSAAGARKAAGEIAGKSPIALAVAREALTRARGLGALEACLDQDLRVSCRFLDVPDFVEGIRAMVVDKDRSPRWSPAGHEGVTEAAVARHFAPLGAGELGLAEPLSIIPHDDKVVSRSDEG